MKSVTWREISKWFFGSLDIALRYDNFFLEVVAEGSHDRARQKAAEIVEFAQTYFRDFEGLGTVIDLNIVDTKHVNEEMRLRKENGPYERDHQM